MTEKFQLINKHLRSTNQFMANGHITNTKASIKFHDINFEDSELVPHDNTCQTNLILEDQLIYLWTEYVGPPKILPY